MTPELADKIRGRPVVVSISGGKDSAATSLYLRELGVEHTRVFADTGWEAAETYEYLRGTLARAIGPIDEVRGKRTFPESVENHGTFPHRLSRFCTEELKLEPLRDYLDAIGEEAINTVGIRRGESKIRSALSEWEWSDFFDAETWRPLIDWTLEDVIAIHRRHGLAPNPLYLIGATRVGCWPCIHARKEEIALVAKHDPDRIALIRDLEARTTATSNARAAAKGKPVPLIRTMFDAEAPGRRYAPLPIDEAVTWARTARGGVQLLLLDNAAHDGCTRWGLCEK